MGTLLAVCDVANLGQHPPQPPAILQKWQRPTSPWRALLQRCI